MADTATIWSYRLYGLHLIANLEIPGMMPVAPMGSADLNVEFCNADAIPVLSGASELLYTSPGLTADGEPFMTVQRRPGNFDAHVMLCYNSGTGYATFEINECGSRVRVSWSEGIQFHDTVAYLTGPVCGIILRLRGHSPLHAGVIAMGDVAIAIIGAKGAGKTTLTAFLASKGRAVVADDIALLSEDQGIFRVMPGYPRLRLWPETIDHFPTLKTDKLQRVLSGQEKRYLELLLDSTATQWRFQQEPLPLAAIYILGVVREEHNISLQSVKQGQGVALLASHAYPECFLGRSMRARDFKILGRICATVPVLCVSRPDGMQHLTHLYECIYENVTNTNKI